MEEIPTTSTDGIIHYAMEERMDFKDGGYKQTFIAYVNAAGNQKYYVDIDMKLTAIPYHFEFEKARYTRGSAYNYEVEVPNVGLAITEACNGYGSGTSMSFIVRSVNKNKKGEINKFTMSPVYGFDSDRKIAYINESDERIFVQSGSKGGEWKPQGCSSYRIYYLWFGRIDIIDKGYDK